jgi:hypothetical protein
MKMTTALAACFGMMLTSSVACAGQFYKWTDAQGVTHYTEEPPPASATGASEVKVSTKLPSGSQPAAAATAKKPGDKGGKSGATATGKKDGKTPAAGDKPAADDKVPGQYAEKCKTLQANLQAMQEHARVKVADEKGETRVLTDEEKQSQLDETQRSIKAFCE